MEPNRPSIPGFDPLHPDALRRFCAEIWLQAPTCRSAPNFETEKVLFWEKGKDYNKITKCEPFNTFYIIKKEVRAVLTNEGGRVVSPEIALATLVRFQGPKQARAAGQPHSNTPRYGYSRLDSIPNRAI